MNAELVRGLIRMGFFIGVHTEHGHDEDRLDTIVDALVAPVVQAMGVEGALPSSGYAASPCQSIHITHGQCVMGGSRHVAHGTRDGGGQWHSWSDLTSEKR